MVRHPAQTDADSMRIFECPRCSVPLTEVSGPGTIAIVCGECRFKYRVLTGTAAAKGARQNAIQSVPVRASRVHGRLNELQLALPGDSTETITFNLPRRENPFTVQAGDLVSVVYTMRHDRLEDLLGLINHTTGEDLPIGRAGQRADANTVGLGCTASILFYVVLAIWIGISIGASFVIGAAVGLAVFLLLRSTVAPVHTITPGESHELDRRRTLLLQKRQLRAELEALRRDLSERGRAKERLQSLRDRMSMVGADLYQTRLEAITAALSTLEEHAAVERQLESAYEKTVLMIDIELESNLASELVREDAFQVIQERTHELAEMKMQNDRFRDLLAASEEIERLLKQGS